MLQWIMQYWLGILFGLIIAGAAFFRKRIKTWYDTYREDREKKFRKSIVKEIKPMLEEAIQRSDESDVAIRSQIGELQHNLSNVKDEVANVKAGLLSVQSAAFKVKCREYLKPDASISLEQFELLERDHEAYNGLGGNHDGDQLFQLVKKKFENSLK